MKIAILGRTSLLLRSAEALLSAGHQVVFVGTSKPADFYDTGPDDFAALATCAGAVFRLGGGINSAEYVADLRQSGAQVAVSVNWPVVIGPDAIAAFPHGVLNAHAGDLPRYRGNACPNWAILMGEERVGVCVHRMVPGDLDSGPILGRRFLPLTDETYIGEVYDWLENAIPELFVEVVAGLEAGTAVEQPQSPDPADWLRCYPRRPEDSEIDWSQSADAILRLVRASSRPFSGAYTHLEGRDKVTIWRAVRYDHVGPFLAVPGQVLLRVNGDPVVACGQGAVRLTDLSIGDAQGREAAAAVAASLRNRLGSPELTFA